MNDLPTPLSDLEPVDSDERRQLNVRVRADTLKLLKLLAIHRDMNVQDCVDEALVLLFETHGLAARKKR